MKNLLKIAMICIALLTVGTTLQSCKKGTEDPTISFKSRKARVAGEYTLTAMNTKGEDKEYLKIGNCEQTTVTNYDGTYSNSMTIRKVTGTSSYKNCPGQTDSTYTFTGADTTYITMEASFDKDGNYKWITKEIDDPAFPSVNEITTEEGTWNFVSGVGEVKNKEQIILNRTKYTVAKTNSSGTVTTTTTESKSTYSTIISLKSLRSDEIIMVMEESYKSPNGNSSYTETNEITLTEK